MAILKRRYLEFFYRISGLLLKMISLFFKISFIVCAIACICSCTSIHVVDDHASHGEQSLQEGRLEIDSEKKYKLKKSNDLTSVILIPMVTSLHGDSDLRFDLEFLDRKGDQTYFMSATNDHCNNFYSYRDNQRKQDYDFHSYFDDSKSLSEEQNISLKYSGIAHSNFQYVLQINQYTKLIESAAKIQYLVISSRQEYKLKTGNLTVMEESR